MSGTSLSVGQFTEFAAAVLKALPRDISPADALAWAQNGERLTEALASALCPLATPALRKSGVLVSLAQTRVGISQTRDPGEYFQCRDGLWVSDDFRYLIVAKAAEDVVFGTYFDLVAVDLGKDANDTQVESALPQDHIFGESMVCAIIAELIEQQSVGRPGVLLNNGYSNLFYTRSCFVNVYWHAGNREWSVKTWTRGFRTRSAGDRVFFPAN